MHDMHRVFVAESNGVPTAEVPCGCMWELVEYLSYQRVAVRYDFKHTHFTVTFPHQSTQRSQQLLDEWAQTRDRVSGDVIHAP